VSKFQYIRNTLLKLRNTYRSLFSFPVGVQKAIKMTEFIVEIIVG